VIFVGMGCDDARKVAERVYGPVRVGHFDLIVAVNLALKRNTAVNHEPTIIVAEEVQVHANFTGAAKGQKPQLLVRGLAKFHDDF
jgi:hypothetical protein